MIEINLKFLIFHQIISVNYTFDRSLILTWWFNEKNPNLNTKTESIFGFYVVKGAFCTLITQMA